MALQALYANSFSVAPTATLIATYILGVIIYRIYFHPLSSFPGPFLGKFTEYDSWGSILTRDRSLKHYRLLKQHGSPIRMSTNTLVFADAKSWVDIYGQSSEPCLKDGSFYEALTITGASNLVSVTHRQGHARLRRLLAHSFSERALLESEDLFAAKVEDYIQFVFESANSENVIEILHHTHNHYLDLVSHLSFGRSFNCMRGDYPTAFDDLNEFSNVLVPTALFTKTFFPSFGWLLTPWLKENLKGLKRLENFGRSATNEYLDEFRKKGIANMPRTFLRNLIASEDSESETRLSEEELVENSIIFLRAGSSTTAVTTLYCLWACCKSLETMKKVVKEIRQAFPDRHKMPTYAEASRLVYLGCTIQETFRLFGTLNVSLPRVSPGRLISGHFIPTGTVVQTSPYATARDPLVFQDPEVFRPERWLDATPEMRAMSRPFSWGPRNCIGKHMAEIGLYLTITRLLQLYDIEIDASTTDEMMEPKDIGVLEPKGERLFVKVKLAVRDQSRTNG